MAHFAKYTKGSVGGLTKHYERAKDEQGNYYRFKNEGIDAERSPLNYNLAPHQLKQLDFVNERLDEVYCLKRDDVKVMCSWVVTCPKTVPEEHTREFFERSYKFLEERYGKENVISAYVHMDETTPHMHFAFIPVVYDKKKDREKVSAKEVATKLDLKTFHTDLQAEMDRFVKEHEYEFECDVLNGATENGNLTVQGLKAKELETRNEIEMEFLEQVIERSNDEGEKLQATVRKLESVENELKGLEARKSTLEDEINALEGKMDALEVSDKGLLAKFLELPSVKEAFAKFCENVRAMVEQRKAERQLRSERSGMDYFRTAVERNNSSLMNRQENPFGNRSNNPFEQSFENENESEKE